MFSLKLFKNPVYALLPWLVYNNWYALCCMHRHTAYHMTMWYVYWSCGTCICFFDYVIYFQNHRKLQFRIFKGQKWLKLWHKRKPNLCVILHYLLHHNQPSAWCGTAGHATCGVWSHTPYNHWVFSLIFIILICIKLLLKYKLLIILTSSFVILSIMSSRILAVSVGKYTVRLSKFLT